MIEYMELNNREIEVQVSLVLCDKGGQPLHVKGEFAEDELPCPRR